MIQRKKWFKVTSGMFHYFSNYLVFVIFFINTTENANFVLLFVFKCIHVNVSSIAADKEDLERVIELQEPNIILCLETCTIRIGYRIR